TSKAQVATAIKTENPHCSLPLGTVHGMPLPRSSFPSWEMAVHRVREALAPAAFSRRAAWSALRTVVPLGEVPSYLTRSHQVGQQAKIPRLVSAAPGHNRRVNAQPLCQLHHRERGRMVLHAARLPHVLWNEGLFSPLVRFIFFGVPAHAFDIAQTEVVDERLIALAVHVTPDMRQFM